MGTDQQERILPFDSNAAHDLIVDTEVQCSELLFHEQDWSSSGDLACQMKFLARVSPKYSHRVLCLGSYRG